MRYPFRNLFEKSDLKFSVFGAYILIRVIFLLSCSIFNNMMRPSLDLCWYINLNENSFLNNIVTPLLCGELETPSLINISCIAESSTDRGTPHIVTFKAWSLGPSRPAEYGFVSYGKMCWFLKSKPSSRILLLLWALVRYIRHKSRSNWMHFTASPTHEVTAEAFQNSWFVHHRFQIEARCSSSILVSAFDPFFKYSI